MHLAQLNIAESLAPLDDPLLKEFVDNLDRINELAEQSQGFIWRLKGDDQNDATEFVLPSFPNAIINMSVWRSPEELRHFVYKTGHVEFLKRKKEWFHKLKHNHVVLWWIEEGHVPSLEEAESKLQLLQNEGESPDAFTFTYLAKQTPTNV